jgi:hypothetical protein
MPCPRLQRAATARREKVQLRIREQSFVLNKRLQSPSNVDFQTNHVHLFILTEILSEILSIKVVEPEPFILFLLHNHFITDFFLKKNPAM